MNAKIYKLLHDGSGLARCSEIGFHPATKRTIFYKRYDDREITKTIRLHIPNVVSITCRERDYPVMIVRAHTPFSSDFDQVIISNSDWWFWCLGGKAYHAVRDGKINGYDAWLRTTFDFRERSDHITFEKIMPAETGYGRDSLGKKLQGLLGKYEIIEEIS